MGARQKGVAAGVGGQDIRLKTGTHRQRWKTGTQRPMWRKRTHRPRRRTGSSVRTVCSIRSQTEQEKDEVCLEELNKKELLNEILELDRKEPIKDIDVAVSGEEQKLMDPGANKNKKQVEECLEELDKKKLLHELEVRASDGVQEPTYIGGKHELIDPGGGQEVQ